MSLSERRLEFVLRFGIVRSMWENFKKHWLCPGSDALRKWSSSGIWYLKKSSCEGGKDGHRLTL